MPINIGRGSSSNQLCQYGGNFPPHWWRFILIAAVLCTDNFDKLINGWVVSGLSCRRSKFFSGDENTLMKSVTISGLFNFLKRSEINAIMRSVQQFLAEHQFHLPPFANWTSEQWRANGLEFVRVDFAPMPPKCYRLIRESQRRVSKKAKM